jgi:hypothetical protein
LIVGCDRLSSSWCGRGSGGSRQQSAHWFRCFRDGTRRVDDKSGRRRGSRIIDVRSGSRKVDSMDGSIGVSSSRGGIRGDS